MNILFMGTPDFAVAVMKSIINAKYNIVAVVTQPDKPKGRGHKMMPTEVKTLALEHNIKVYQPTTLRNGELMPILDELKPDIIIVVAYGKILPKYVIDYPKYGCINVHASLLPKYRGAAPIQWAIINGDKTTGVTTMYMDEGLDTGDMLFTKQVQIGEYETSEELFERLSVVGGEAIIETIKAIEDGSIKRTPQDHENYTYAPMINKDMARIDWKKPAREISKLICGMNSWPLAYTEYKGETLKILMCTVQDENPNGECGQILGYEKGKGLRVKCGEGVIYITKAQFFGSKKMSIDDYLLGHNVEIDTILQ